MKVAIKYTDDLMKVAAVTAKHIDKKPLNRSGGTGISMRKVNDRLKEGDNRVTVVEFLTWYKEVSKYI